MEINSPSQPIQPFSPPTPLPTEQVSPQYGGGPALTKEQELELAAKERLKGIEPMEEHPNLKFKHAAEVRGPDGRLYLSREGKDGKIKHYCIEEELGKGHFGSVTSMRHTTKDKELAFKRPISIEEARQEFGSKPETIAPAQQEMAKAVTEFERIRAESGGYVDERPKAAENRLITAKSALAKAQAPETQAQHRVQKALREIVNEASQLSEAHDGKKSPLWGIMDRHSHVLLLPSNPSVAHPQVAILPKLYDDNYGHTIAATQSQPWDEQKLEQSLCETHQLLGGLAFLAEREQVHGDIKPDNVLVREGVFPDEPALRQVHLADFGKAKSGKEMHDRAPSSLVMGSVFNSYATEQDQTRATALHEAGDKKGFLEQEKKRDAFALGCTLYSRFEGHLPYKTAQTGYRDISSGDVESRFSEHVPLEVKQIIQGLLEPDPQRRLSALEAFKRLDQLIQQEHPALYARMQALGSPNPETLLSQNK